MTLLLQFTDELPTTRHLPAAGRAAQVLLAATREISYLDDSSARIAGRLGES
jgi:hypothetical protein